MRLVLVAQRLAVGSQTEFMQTKAFQDIASSISCNGTFPVIERLATATERGGVAGYQTEFANLPADIERSRESAQSSRVLHLHQVLTHLVHKYFQVYYVWPTADDAAAGFVKLSEDDIAAVGAIETQRRFTLAMEGVNNEIIKSGGFAANITKLNEANAYFINEIRISGCTTI